MLFLYACLAGLSHILLDFTNNYGVRPFWPFSEKWYSWDIVFIVEPVMLGFLVLGLVIPALSSLIDKEIGVRQRGPRGQVAATLALVGIVLLWGLRDYEHRRAVNALEARTYNGADPLRASAYPKWIDPFHWYGVVETPAFFALAQVNSLAPEVDPEGSMEIRYKPEETPVTLAAKNSYIGRVFLDWAQYPVTETEVLQPPAARVYRPFSGSAVCRDTEITQGAESRWPQQSRGARPKPARGRRCLRHRQRSDCRA